MSIKIKNWLVFVLLSFLISCQKKDNVPVDLSKVTVTFNDPTQGQVFHKGDTIQINTNVSYPAEIAGIGLQITDSITDSLVYEDDQDTHTSNFPFKRSWVDTFSTNATLEVKILVFVADNTTVPAVRSIYIKAMP